MDNFYREIWHIAPDNHPAYKSILYYQQLRYRLLPYIYSIAGKTYHGDYTIMRGLAHGFFLTDPNVLSIGDQYMFGPSLLVNPCIRISKLRENCICPLQMAGDDLYSGRSL